MSDLLDEGARLMTEFGERYTRARRYRAVAAECEERHLGRALAIGSALREWARAATGDDADHATAIDELRALVRACEEAIGIVHDSPSYRAACVAWDEGRFHDVAALAPTIFDAIEPLTTPRTLYAPVPIVGRRGGEHFSPPAVVAERIAGLARTGLPAADPVPQLGADECLRAVVLDDDPEAVEAPITIIVAAEDLALPSLRLAPAGEIFVYAPLLRARLRVRCAPEAHDEWWTVRPEAYVGYVRELVRELAIRGITDVARG